MYQSVGGTQSDQTRDWTELAQFAFPDVRLSPLLSLVTMGRMDTEQEDEELYGEVVFFLFFEGTVRGKGPNKGENKAAWRQPFLTLYQSIQ